jgi:predicted HTH transcriptional regulator
LKIQNNPFITRNDLVESTGLTVNKVRGYLEKLKRDGVIRRVGSNRKGYWEIVKK